MDSFGSSSTIKRRSPPPLSQRPSAPSSPSPAQTSLPSASVPLYPASLSSGPGLTPRSQKPKAHLYPSPSYPLTASTTYPRVNGTIIPNGSSYPNGIMSSPDMAPLPPGEPSLRGPHGPYAYSTTLRRQASIDPFTGVPHVGIRHDSPRRASSLGSRGHGSPRRKRSNGVPPESDMPVGVISRIVGLGRRMWYGRGYTQVSQDEEDVVLVGGQDKETPSAIYAHKTIDVSNLTAVVR